MKRSLWGAIPQLSTKDRGGRLARSSGLCAHPCPHLANLEGHPETTPDSCPSHLCLRACDLSPCVLTACPISVAWDGCPAAAGCLQPQDVDRSCLSCTTTVPAPGLGLSIFIQLQGLCFTLCPVVEATSEGMVGILRLSHSWTGKNTFVGWSGQGMADRRLFFSALC